MKNDPTRILEISLEKAKKDQNFSKDLVNYLKYLTLKYCPKERILEFDSILNYGDLRSLFVLTSQIVPNYDSEIIDYINNY